MKNVVKDFKYRDQRQRYMTVSSQSYSVIMCLVILVILAQHIYCSTLLTKKY